MSGFPIIKKGIEGPLDFNSDVYIRKNTFDYNTLDFIELNKPNPKKYPVKTIHYYNYSEPVKN